ncbi:MAG: Phosphatidylglycerophosphate synthetase [Promethearchaeota archaeon]|nr:MAG: Phosphatidylglycerophosphate synthetase [Candidatus Lokiarchaeota archaeon]
MNKVHIPHLLTLFRIFLAFIVFNFIEMNAVIINIFIYLTALFTDILDGFVARKLNVCSTFGGYFDAAADFILIFNIFTIFMINGIFPYWVLLLLSFMFFQFIISSKLEKPIYDPIGKYFLTYLSIIIVISHILTNKLVQNINLIIIVTISLISLISRYASFLRQKDKEKLIY